MLYYAILCDVTTCHVNNISVRLIKIILSEDIFKLLLYNLQPNSQIVENMSRSLVWQFFDVHIMTFLMQRM